MRFQTPADDIQNKVKRELKRLLDGGLINEEEKIKLDSQIRPVVTTIDDPVSKISKFLINVFRNFRKYDTLSVKNSAEFIERVGETTIEQEEDLVSFDVVALYPSIQEEEAKRCLRNG